MTLTEVINVAQDNAGKIASTVGSIAAIWATRKPVIKFLRERFSFQRDMRSAMTCMSGRVSNIENLITNGISHEVALLAAQQHQVIRAEMQPMFICNELGENSIVSIGYCFLLGVEDPMLLKSTRWQDSLCGDNVDEYLASFSRAVDHQTGFATSCGFRNPMTGEYRGKWRVIATCTPVNKALIFSGRFIPDCNVAIGIAKSRGWILSERPINP